MIMKHLNNVDIEAFPQLYKINLLKSLSTYNSKSIVVTKCVKGKVNVSNGNSMTYVGLKPVVIGISLKLDKTRMKTYRGIKETGYFTINGLGKRQIKDLGTKKGKVNGLLEKLNSSLGLSYKRGFCVPYINGSNLQIGLKFLEEHHLKVNGTVLVLGQVVDIHFRKSVISGLSYLKSNKERISMAKGLLKYLRNYSK